MRRSIPCTVVAYMGSTRHWPLGAPYVYYSTKRPNRIGPIYVFTSEIAILHDNACRHDDIFGCVCKLFQDEVDHLPQRRIFVLEKFRYAKEKRGSFGGWKLLAGKEKHGNL